MQYRIFTYADIAPLFNHLADKNVPKDNFRRSFIWLASIQYPTFIIEKHHVKN
ncbi:hypothetical protein M2347_002137 [Chryseobacterium sp. H1D6B]|uniref:hypothetical protein n=1 Tax=Chryseobacterium sp. H1D6B TaxID=2940588 RepID=UPI0015CD9B89|nr:hypothetical protein [Chryseobacterium sp. H1D6B]MDH6252410.1 hypothetical protein [Chryseobacterium sp. H1D6B]